MGKRGRPAKGGPVVVTTVRIPVELYNWVKARKAEFSALMRRAIVQAQREEEDRELVQIIRDRRAAETPSQTAFRTWVSQQNRPIGADELAEKRRELGL